LNSFAILLTGSQAQDASKETPGTQQNVATRLRVALCLEIMKNYDTADLFEKEDLKDFFVHNHKALATDHCRHMVRILKRPVISVHKTGPNNSSITSTWYDNFFFEKTSLNEEPFFVYHVGSYHFEPLIREIEHHQGEVYLNYSQVDFEDENNSSGKRSIVFTLKPGSLKKQNFSATQSSRLDSAGFPNKNKIRVSYSENNEEINKMFKEEKEGHLDEHGIKKNNMNIFLRVLKADELSVNGNQIILNRKSIHGGTIQFLP
jgi:hypothetical protein